MGDPGGPDRGLGGPEGGEDGAGRFGGSTVGFEAGQYVVYSIIVVVTRPIGQLVTVGGQAVIVYTNVEVIVEVVYGGGVGMLTLDD